MLGVGDAAAERAERRKAEKRLDEVEVVLSTIWEALDDIPYVPDSTRRQQLERLAIVSREAVSRYRSNALMETAEMSIKEAA